MMEINGKISKLESNETGTIKLKHFAKIKKLPQKAE
jgi:hypothetical protein